LAWREAETARTWQVPASILARRSVLQDQVALEGRRFTPWLSPLGFVEAAHASPATRLNYVPDTTCHQLGMIFRETAP
jgi:hypothetical protein